jgi:endonuclease/exonuclease/phosphatase family metal-dependent hydrolase
MPASSAARNPTTATDTAPRSTAFKVLTVNVHKGFTTFNRRFILPELRDAVRSVGADLVFLQEVLGTHRRHASRLANFPQVPHYEFLADSLWSQYAYGRNAVYDNGHHGNALLSKFPIVHYQNHDISISGPERRGMLHCVLQPPHHPHPVHAICVHLGLQESHRQQQLLKVCDLIRSFPAGEPVVLAGDFNDWRHRAHGVLRREVGMREIFVHAHGRAVRTFPASMPILALDRIYVRNTAVHTPLAMPRKPWDKLSDHAPLAAEIRL